MPVPSAPTNLFLLPIGLNSIKVIWKANVNLENITGYYLTLSNGTTTINATIPTMNADGAGFYSYVFNGSAPPRPYNNSYGVTVQSINSSGIGPVVRNFVRTYNVPPPVTNLTATLKHGYFVLGWDPPSMTSYWRCGETIQNALELIRYRISLSANNGPWAVYKDMDPFGYRCYNQTFINIPLPDSARYRARVRCLYRPLFGGVDDLLSIYPPWSPIGLTADRQYIGSAPIEMSNSLSGNDMPGIPTINYVRLSSYTYNTRTIEFSWNAPTNPGNYPIVSYQIYLNHKEQLIAPKITQNGNTFIGSYFHVGPRLGLYSIQIRAVNSNHDVGLFSEGKTNFVLDPYGPTGGGVVARPVSPSLRP